MLKIAVVVDMQHDFLIGGKLYVPGSEDILEAILDICDESDYVIATRDWHPEDHQSFVTNGGQWPVHCVQDTPGARFHPLLKLPDSAIVVTKGVRFDRDQYSAFDATGLATELRKKGVTRLWVGGLAQDVCVRATVLDARREYKPSGWSDANGRRMCTSTATWSAAARRFPSSATRRSWCERSGAGRRSSSNRFCACCWPTICAPSAATSRSPYRRQTDSRAGR